MTLIPGAVLSDRYLIHHEIGRGGYSLVYLAEDRLVGSEVAIKLLVPPPAVAQVARERMRREVRAARSLVHDNIVSVYGYMEDDEACYVVMEYIAGPDLAKKVREDGPLAAEETAELGRQVADALTAAHRSGILHRDVKPQNILIDPDGKAHLADFGSARLDGQTSMTHTGGFVGTLSYLAPEVIRGERPDARADIYALGLTLYYALTGDLPPRQAAQLPPEPSDGGFRVGSGATIPSWLDDVVARATSANPSRRFATATAMSDALAGRGGENAPALQSRHTCLLCGGADPLKLAVCLRCGGSDGAGRPTLLFIDGHADRTAREKVAGLLAATVENGLLPWVLRGSQALVRLPGQAAERVVERMAAEGVPLRAVRQSRAWAPMPMSYYAMVGGAAGAGLLAGMVAPVLSSLALPVAVLLLLVGQLRLQRPVIRARPAAPRLPESAAPEVLETLRQLPEGVARELMAELVFAGSALYRRWDQGDGEAIDRLAQLLIASCAAVRELADLDDYLRPLQSMAGRELPAVTTYRPRAGIEDTRDALVQRLLEVLAAIDTLRRQSTALALDPSALPTLTEALERRARLEDEALLELEAYLAGTQQESAA